jgi:hypothetical protein
MSSRLFSLLLIGQIFWCSLGSAESSRYWIPGARVEGAVINQFSPGISSRPPVMPRVPVSIHFDPNDSTPDPLRVYAVSPPSACENNSSACQTVALEISGGVPQEIWVEYGSTVTIESVGAGRRLIHVDDQSDWQFAPFSFEVFGSRSVDVGGKIRKAGHINVADIPPQVNKNIAVHLVELARTLNAPFNRYLEGAYPGGSSPWDANGEPSQDTIARSASGSAFILIRNLSFWYSEASNSGTSPSDIPIDYLIAFIEDKTTFKVSFDLSPLFTFGIVKTVDSLRGTVAVTPRREYQPKVMIRFPYGKAKDGSYPVQWIVADLYSYQELTDPNTKSGGTIGPIVRPAEYKWAKHKVSLPSSGVPDDKNIFDALYDKLEKDSEKTDIRAVLTRRVFPGTLSGEVISDLYNKELDQLDKEFNYATQDFMASFVPLYDAAKKQSDGAPAMEVITSATVDIAQLALGLKVQGSFNLLGKAIDADSIARTALKVAAAEKFRQMVVRVYDDVKRSGFTGPTALYMAASVLDMSLTAGSAYSGLDEVAKIRASAEKKFLPREVEERVGRSTAGLGSPSGNQLDLVDDDLVTPFPNFFEPSEVRTPLPENKLTLTAGIKNSLQSKLGATCDAAKNITGLVMNRLSKWDDGVYQLMRKLRVVDSRREIIGHHNFKVQIEPGTEVVPFHLNFRDVTVQAYLPKDGTWEVVAPFDLIYGQRMAIKREGETYLTGKYRDLIAETDGQLSISLLLDNGELTSVTLPNPTARVSVVKMSWEGTQGAQRATAYLPTLEDGSVDQSYYNWLVDTMSLVPRDAVRDDAKVFVYSGRQDTAAYGIVRNLWGFTHTKSGASGAYVRVPNEISIFPSGFTDLPASQRAQYDLPELPPEKASLVRAAGVMAHEVTHSTDAKFALRNFGNAEARDEFAIVWLNRLNIVTVADLDKYRITPYINSLVSNEKTPMANIAIELFAETGALYYLNQIVPLSDKKLKQMKPLFDAYEEFLGVRCKDGFFDLAIRSAPKSRVLFATAPKALMDAAQAALEDDGTEVVQGTLFFDDDAELTTVVGFGTAPAGGSGPTKPNAPSAPSPTPNPTPTPTPVAQGPVTAPGWSGQDCSKIQLEVTELFDCEDFPRDFATANWHPVEKVFDSEGKAVHIAALQSANRWSTFGYYFYQDFTPGSPYYNCRLGSCAFNKGSSLCEPLPGGWAYSPYPPFAVPDRTCPGSMGMTGLYYRQVQ